MVSFGGVGGQTPQPLEARGSRGEALGAGRFLQIFNENNTFLCIFRPKSYSKAIIYQLKAFEKQSKHTVLNK